MYKAVNWNKIGEERRNTTNIFRSPICYNQLNCTSSAEEIGANHCLRAKSDGFRLRSLQRKDRTSGKTWWEGTAPGESIELYLSEPCSEIVIFINQRQTNGMARVEIDGAVLGRNFSDLSEGVLDAYRNTFWLPVSRGLLNDQMIARNLQPKPHVVRLTVLNETNSIDGSFKFDFVSVSCWESIY